MNKKEKKRAENLSAFDIAKHLTAKWILHLRSRGYIDDKKWKEAKKIRSQIKQ